MRSLTLISICVLFFVLINNGYSKPVGESNPIEKGREIIGKVVTELRVIKSKVDEKINSIKSKNKDEKTKNGKSKVEEIKKDDIDKNDEDEGDEETETEIVTEVVTEFIEEEGTTIVYEDEDDTTTEPPTSNTE